MALNTVKLNGGTAGNPVVLSARQIKGLIALYKDDNVTKDCSGYVKASSGKLVKSEYICIQNLGFTIVDTETTPDEFTLYAANSNVVYEGKSIQLCSTGIDINDLIFTVVKHEIVITSGTISEDVIKSRIHISETGLVTVDDAEENVTWQDNITIQAHPNFDPSNKVLISNPITIKGIAISGISIVAANSVIIGSRINVEVNTLPADNSKNNYRLELSANDGIINNNIYTAPDTAVETAIIAECFLFGGNVASFHVEKNVSVIRPVIICNIKDDNEEEVPEAYITITDGVTQAITQLSNGESMTAVLNRTYTIEAFVPEGYTGVTVPETITPTEVETIVNAIYHPLQLGVFAYFNNGKYILYNKWVELGKPKTYDGGTLLGASVKAEGLKMIGLFESVVKLPISTNTSQLISMGVVERSDIETITQEQTRILSDNVADFVPRLNNGATNYAHVKAYNSVYTINDTEYRGRLPNAKEAQVVVANRDNIETILSSINKHTISVKDSIYIWLAYTTDYYNNGYIWLTSYFLNGAYVKTSSNYSVSYNNNYTLPIYDL